MPELPEEAFVQAIELLVSHDKEWVPANSEQSLYLRPFMIATTAALGVGRPAGSYLFLVIASPSGSVFAGSGVRAVSVWLAEGYTRAAPGGTGEAKTGGNYAASFLGQQQAIDNGCDQVVWLDAVEHRWVEEMGGMNLFFVYGSGQDARLVTPPLTGSLLPGITRDSLLTLAPDLGIPASEEAISVEQWRAGCESGEITEVFACGTAAVITPVGEVKGATGELDDRRWSAGPGGDAAARAAAWHPVRPPARPAWLGAQDPLILADSGVAGAVAGRTATPRTAGGGGVLRGPRRHERRLAGADPGAGARAAAVRRPARAGAAAQVRPGHSRQPRLSERSSTG